MPAICRKWRLGRKKRVSKLEVDQQSCNELRVRYLRETYRKRYICYLYTANIWCKVPIWFGSQVSDKAPSDGARMISSYENEARVTIYT